MRGQLEAALCAVLATMMSACGASDPAAPTDAPLSLTGHVPREAGPATGAAPSIDRVTIRPSSPRPGDTLVADVEASDADGDRLTITYSWRLDGRVVGDGGPQLEMPAARRGSRIDVAIVASDGANESEPERLTIRLGNQPPVIEDVVIDPTGAVTVKGQIRANPKVTDPDGDEVSLSYRWWVDGNEVVGDGQSLALDAFERGDSVRLEIVASDGKVESDPWQSPTIEIGNAAPRITSQPGAIDATGRFAYAVEAEDPDGDRRFRYTLLEAPLGMTIDVFGGTVSWTPSQAQTGSHAIEIEVDDRHGGLATQAFTLDLVLEPIGTPAAPDRP